MTSLKKLIGIFNKQSTQILLIILIVLVSYSNILQNGISFDDRDFLVTWPAVKDSAKGLSSFLNLPDLLAGDLPSNHRGVYRPIRSIYYLLSLKVWGFNPLVFHIQAILVHLLIVITIYFVTKQILKSNRLNLKTLPFITASLFAAHPIHTEAVTYTAASFDTLGILFFFASFYFYLRAESIKVSQGASRLLSWLLAFMAFLTYEITLALPILIIFYEICFKKLNFRNFLKRLPTYLPYLLMIGSYLFIRFYWLKIGDRSNLGPSYLVVSNQAKLGIFEILIRYVKLLIFPLNLTVHYSVPDYIFSLFYSAVTWISPSGYLLQKIGDYAIAIPIIAISLLTILTLKIFKNNLVKFSICWFLFSLLPVLNVLPQGSAVAERFLYVPSFGFCLLLGLGIYKLPGLKIIKIPTQTKLLVSVFIFTLIISLYSIRTIIRNLDWKTQESIFVASVNLDPKGYLPNATLGSVKFEEDKLDESIFFTKRAIEANPEDLSSHHQLGSAYEKKGELDKALSEYQTCLKLNPGYSLALFGVANVYKKQGRFEESISEYKKILSKDSASKDNTHITARFNLAGVYTEKKMYSEALKEYQEVAKTDPSGVVHSNIAYIYEMENRLNDAIAEYQQAIEIEPDNFHFRSNLGSVLIKKGDKKSGLKEYQKALELMPEDKSLQQTIKRLEAK